MTDQDKAAAAKVVPVEPRVLEAIAHNVCSLHDFDPEFVKGQEKFARAVITEYVRAATPDGSQWRPIETAPRDGTSILVWSDIYKPGSPVIVSWDDDRYAKNPVPRWETRDRAYGRKSFVDRPPGLWQPLPAAPEGV